MGAPPYRSTLFPANIYLFKVNNLSLNTEPILESKGMRAIFQKNLNRAKYLKIWAKMHKI